ncbi:MAG: flagellar hook protein FlgE [Desulfovibrio sp.]|uniref:flagellar hook protein FlgE n=1 Tax=Desulfovibrio sp. 7SRBS1 TaxID=3378064 RepID=UPI003B404B5C
MGFSSMYVGATGMKAHSTWMQAIGNNLANVDTLGFKGGRTHFENLMSQDLVGGYSNPDGTGSGAGQIGKGVAVANIVTDVRQGGYEPGTASTDLAIGGKGYFKLTSSTDQGDQVYYSRAGNFRFNKNGVLLDPHGYALQGFQIDRNTGAPSTVESAVSLPMQTEIIDGKEVQVIRSDPSATSRNTMISNLDSSASDKSQDAENPFFAMLKNWNSSSATPLTEEQYSYTTGMTVYDSEGNQQKLIYYFDPVTTNSMSSEKQWEYLVTVDPTSADGRSLATSGAQGVYMAGTLSFNAAGDIIDQTAYTLKDPSLDAGALSNWTLAPIGANGDLMMDVTFTTSNGGSLPSQTIGINFGLTGENASWNVENANAGQVGSNASALPRQVGTATSGLAMTSYNSSSVTLSQTQDGYGEGYLQNVTVDKTGMLAGKFSNGQTENLYQINLYNFSNEYGLRHEGGNLYRAGNEAGTVYTGKPDSANYGVMYQDTLETSNVDMAVEFTDMIRGQRGFQANSKVVTTTDSLLNTLIQVKR